MQEHNAWRLQRETGMRCIVHPVARRTHWYLDAVTVLTRTRSLEVETLQWAGSGTVAYRCSRSLKSSNHCRAGITPQHSRRWTGVTATMETDHRPSVLQCWSGGGQAVVM